MSRHFNNNKEVLIKNSGDNRILIKNTVYDKKPIDIFERLQLGFYYWNPKHDCNKEVIIPLYLTDLNQIEEREDEFSEVFTLRLDIDGKVSYINNLSAGDIEVSLGYLSEGMHYFSMQIEDQHGRTSPRLFNEIWCINPSTYNITAAQTYTVTDSDLNRFGIKKNNSETEEDMTNTRVGLTKLLSEIKNRGYRKAILPYGIYRINRALRRGQTDETRAIQIPTNFTLDLNQATIKLQPYDDRDLGGAGQVTNVSIEFEECVDSHLINGILEGDYAERLTMIKDGVDAASGTNGEGNQSVYIWGGRYNSLRNITFKQMTGYMVSTIYSGIINPLKTIGISDYTVGKYLNVDGSMIDKEEYSVSPFVDISNYTSNRLQINKYLGYGGFAGEDVCYNICFYDKEKQFIEGFKAMQFRSLIIPNNAKFIRYSIKSIDNNNLVSVFDPNTPRYCEVVDCDFIDNKTCVAPAKVQHLLMKNLTFTRSGQRLTPCAIDFEDGWEEAQDIFFENIEILEQSGTADIIICSGMNHVFKNVKNARTHFRDRMIGFVVKDCTFPLLVFSIDGIREVKNHYYKFDNAIIKDLNISPTVSNNPTARKIYQPKNSSIGRIFNNQDGLYPIDGVILKDNTDESMVFDHTIIKNSDIYINNKMFYNNTIFRNCNFYINEDYETTKTSVIIQQSINCKVIFENCTFNFTKKLGFNYNYQHIEFNHCTFNCVVDTQDSNNPGMFKKIFFNHCNFKEVVNIGVNKSNVKIFVKQCIFEKKVLSSIYPSIVDVENNQINYYGCEFKIFEDNSGDGTAGAGGIHHYDCAEGTGVTSLPVIEGLICHLDAFDLDGSTTWVDRLGNYNATLTNFLSENMNPEGGLLRCNWQSSSISIPTLNNFKSVYIGYEMNTYKDYIQLICYNNTNIVRVRLSDNSHLSPSSIVCARMNQKDKVTNIGTVGHNLTNINEGQIRNVYYEFTDVDNKVDIELFKSSGDVRIAYIMLFDRALSEDEIDLLYGYNKKINKTRY